MRFYTKIENKQLYDSHFQDGKEVEVIKDPEFNVSFGIVWLLRKGSGAFKSRDAVVATMQF